MSRTHKDAPFRLGKHRDVVYVQEWGPDAPWIFNTHGGKKYGREMKDYLVQSYKSNEGFGPAMNTYVNQSPRKRGWKESEIKSHRRHARRENRERSLDLIKEFNATGSVDDADYVFDDEHEAYLW